MLCINMQLDFTNNVKDSHIWNHTACKKKVLESLQLFQARRISENEKHNTDSEKSIEKKNQK